MSDDFKAAQAQLRTLRDFIRFGASRFNAAGVCFGHGTDNAVDEAAALVLHALHLPPDLASPYHDARLLDSEKRAILELFERRVSERLPAAYLTHEAWFAGLPFYVDEQVLVPRSPIAELIQTGFSPWLEIDPETILDLCTGSGCIGIACAYAYPEARVDLSDISDGALKVARENIRRHDLGARVSALQSDLFEGLEHRCYDLIVSNPPYVSSAEMAALPREYLHEPSLGLAAGHDGLDIARRILAQAGEHLNPEGLLVVEVGASAAALIDAWPDVPFIWPEFAHGGDGVFALGAAALHEYQGLFRSAA